jgi:membrane protein DedA with SNARE-associated domain
VPARSRTRTRRIVLWSVLGLAALVVVAVVLHLVGDDGFGTVSEDSGNWAYVAVFCSVFGDAIFPVLPGETALNAASTLAAAGSLDLGLVMLAGALGAIVGDSTLYWIARISRARVEPQIEKAKQNDKVAAALDFMGSSAPALIILGRYVPGLRFVVNATMGLAEYPYRRFILWSAIGGAAWSVYTCGLAYLVGTALADFPLASVVISGAITTAAIAALFLVVRRRRRGPGGPAVEAV